MVLPAPERRVAAGKPISPISIDPPLLSPEKGIGPWASLAAIAANAAKITAMATEEGYWLTEGSFPNFTLPQGRIVDLDFALAAITAAWVEAYVARQHVVRARGFGSNVFLAVDVDEYVLKHAKNSLLKKHLMTYWGDKLAVSARYPDNFRKPFLNNVRKLGSAGWIALTKPVNNRGLLSYLVAPSQRGFIRAVWIATTTGTPNPLETVLAASSELRAAFTPTVDNLLPQGEVRADAPIADEATDIPRRQQLTKATLAIRAQKARRRTAEESPAVTAKPPATKRAKATKPSPKATAKKPPRKAKKSPKKSAG